MALWGLSSVVHYTALVSHGVNQFRQKLVETLVDVVIDAFGLRVGESVSFGHQLVDSLADSLDRLASKS